jgi:tRNA modification GTPase
VQDTIAAIATAPGVGAIAVIRLSGTDAIRICNQTFKGKNLEQQASHTMHLGKILSEEQDIIDEVLVSLFVGPHSYTGENTVEVSCHGSMYIQQRLLERFIRAGARLAKPGEFTMRAFLNGKLDLSQAEAVGDLIAAESESAHQMAMQQMRGGISKEIGILRERLIEFAALIELELDFGEEDVEFANRNDLKDLVKHINARIESLLQSFMMGNVLKNGVATAIVGRPNAGKSSWINALSNDEVSIVSEIAGTTRDKVENTLNIEGVHFRLIDTAGIRESDDQIEQIGVSRAREQIAKAQAIIYVFDITALSFTELEKDIEEISNSNPNAPILIIANKSDLILEGWQSIGGTYQVYSNLHFLSAKRPDDVQFVKKQLLDLLKLLKPGTSNVTVSNVRHYEALLKANTSLLQVLQGLDTGTSGDLLAMDIKYGLNALGEITGQVDVEDLLEYIFGKFCIGK